MSCAQCAGIENQFGQAVARKKLRRFRRRGPDKTTQRLYGAVYPRKLGWMRVGIATINVVQRLKRSTFRSFLHDPAEIDKLLRQSGLERSSTHRTLGWEVVVYQRQTP